MKRALHKDAPIPAGLKVKAQAAKVVEAKAEVAAEQPAEAPAEEVKE